MYFIRFIHRDTVPIDVWKKFYGDEYDGNPYNSCTNCKVEAKKGEIFVSDSLFFSQRQGSIVISSGTIKSLHSSCRFENSYRQEFGGSVFIDALNPIIQYRFCATNSRSGSFGLFSYTRVASGGNDFNYVIESSILNCKDQSQSRVITMDNGICGITASNFSKNVVYWVAAMCINYAKDECIVNFSTIEKNTASYSMIMEFQDGVKYHAYLCNIVGNSKKSSNKGIIRTNNAELIVENCTILGNPEPGSSLYSDGTLKVINCNVDNYFRINGNAASTVKVFTTKIIYKLHHLSTYKCEAIYPLREEFININSDIDHPYVFNFSFLIYYSSEINIAMLY